MIERTGRTVPERNGEENMRNCTRAKVYAKEESHLQKRRLEPANTNVLHPAAAKGGEEELDANRLESVHRGRPQLHHIVAHVCDSLLQEYHLRTPF
tara:strand:- start:90 stop:377 length:288 start_codon:yes stop_codon:yes gene_type:complete